MNSMPSNGIGNTKSKLPGWAWVALAVGFVGLMTVICLLTALIVRTDPGAGSVQGEPQIVYVTVVPTAKPAQAAKPTARPPTAVPAPTGPFGCTIGEMQSIVNWAETSAALFTEGAQLTDRITSTADFDWPGWYNEADSIYRRVQANRSNIPTCFRDDADNAQTYMENSVRDLRDAIGLVGDGDVDGGLAKLESATRWAEKVSPEFDRLTATISSWAGGL